MVVICIDLKEQAEIGPECTSNPDTRLVFARSLKLECDFSSLESCTWDKVKPVCGEPHQAQELRRRVRVQTRDQCQAQWCS